MYISGLVHRSLGVWVVGVGMLAGIVATAGAQDPKADVFRLQLQRFAGTYSVGTGRWTATFDGESLTVSGNLTAGSPIRATAAYSVSDRKGVGTITLDQVKSDGSASVDGRELRVEAKQGNEIRRVTLRLKGRDEIELLVTSGATGGETTLLSATGRREP